MQLAERTMINASDPRYEVIDRAAFASKNLWNAANYLVRQSFIHEHIYLDNVKVYHQIRSHEAYKGLPAKVGNQILIQLHKAWVAFFEAMKAWREDPSKFTGRPKLPKYKDKEKGRNLLVYEKGAISKRALKRGQLSPCGLGIEIPTQQAVVKQARIAPRSGFYVIEVVYSHEQPKSAVNPAYYAGIDIGRDNLAALTSNKPDFVPVLVNGRPMKSVNQFYNKRKAELQSKLGRTGTTKRMERLTNKRNRRIDHYMHTASRWIIEDLVAHGIGTLVIGKNDGWKQNVNMGKQNNQNCVMIPHAKFIQMLTYKAELVGIRVILTEESYTSVASFLDRDEMPVYGEKREEEPKFSGKRIKRGLYRAADGTLISADCNGSGNIIRKVAPDAFQQAEGVEDGKSHKPVVHPVRLVVVPSRSQKGEILARYQTL